MESETSYGIFPTREFHVSKKIRHKYSLADSLFKLSGEALISDFTEIRKFTEQFNQNRDNPVNASDLNALGLIHESIHYIISLYKQQIDKNVITNSIEYLADKLSIADFEIMLKSYCDEFPTNEVYHQNTAIKSYINGETDGIPNSEIIIEEILLLWLENQNPAFQPFNELFNDKGLIELYSMKHREAEKIFEHTLKLTQNKFGSDNFENIYPLSYLGLVYQDLGDYDRAIENQKFDAVLDYIAPKGIAENGAIQFEIKGSLKAIESTFIRAGLSANASIILEKAENVLAIKEALVQYDKKSKKPFVEIEIGDQKFERKEITLGISDGIFVEVKNGISKDDKIKIWNQVKAGPFNK